MALTDLCNSSEKTVCFTLKRLKHSAVIGSVARMISGAFLQMARNHQITFIENEKKKYLDAYWALH